MKSTIAKLNIISESNGIPYLYATSSDLTVGRRPVHRKDLLALHGNITSRLTGSHQRFTNIGRGGNLHILKHKHGYKLICRDDGNEFYISRGDLLHLHTEIARTLMGGLAAESHSTALSISSAPQQLELL